MIGSTIYKYYDLRYRLHRAYLSPVEYKEMVLKSPGKLTKRGVDTVQISKEALDLYAKTLT